MQQFLVSSHLVIAGRVTSLLAFTAALKQFAPSVSMASIGTVLQPTLSMPCDTPIINPPPPTDRMTTSGGRDTDIDVNCSADSSINDSWPCLTVRLMQFVNNVE